MGSGKTTVGKKVAKLTGRPFVDSDVELTARSGRSVAQWFEQDGEDGFRRAESDLLADLLSAPEPLVIGSGGGVVVLEANRTLLQDPGATVIYLHGRPEFLASRAEAKPHRPLLKGDPRAVFADMYAQRDAWYREVADAVVEIKPAHDAGQKPKWRIAEVVSEVLVDIGVVAAHQVTDREAVKR